MIPFDVVPVTTSETQTINLCGVFPATAGGRGELWLGEGSFGFIRFAAGR